MREEKGLEFIADGFKDHARRLAYNYWATYILINALEDHMFYIRDSKIIRPMIATAREQLGEYREELLRLCGGSTYTFNEIVNAIRARYETILGGLKEFEPEEQVENIEHTGVKNSRITI